MSPREAALTTAARQDFRTARERPPHPPLLLPVSTAQGLSVPQRPHLHPGPIAPPSGEQTTQVGSRDATLDVGAHGAGSPLLRRDAGVLLVKNE